VLAEKLKRAIADAADAAHAVQTASSDDPPVLQDSDSDSDDEGELTSSDDRAVSLALTVKVCAFAGHKGTNTRAYIVLMCRVHFSPLTD
jgi:hypothetical protein